MNFISFPGNLSQWLSKHALHILICLIEKKRRKKKQRIENLVFFAFSRMRWTQKSQRQLGLSGSEPLLQRSAISHHAILCESLCFVHRRQKFWLIFDEAIFSWTSSEGTVRNQASHECDTTHSSLSNFLSFKQQRSPHLTQTVQVFFFSHFFLLFSI